MTNLDKLEAFIIREGRDSWLSTQQGEKCYPASAVRTFFSSLLSEQETGEGIIFTKSQMQEFGNQLLASFFEEPAGSVENELNKYISSLRKHDVSGNY